MDNRDLLGGQGRDLTSKDCKATRRAAYQFNQLIMAEEMIQTEMKETATEITKEVAMQAE